MTTIFNTLENKILSSATNFIDNNNDTHTHEAVDLQDDIIKMTYSVTSPLELVGNNISIKDASTSQVGVVQLSNAVDSNSESTAATSKAVKNAISTAVSSINSSIGTTLAQNIAITNPLTLTTANNKTTLGIKTASETQLGVVKLHNGVNRYKPDSTEQFSSAELGTMAASSLAVVALNDLLHAHIGKTYIMMMVY